MTQRTLNEVKRTFDTGVIVARFQVAELHDEHRALINTVKERCKNVIIFLGLAAVAHSRNNPLDFQSRKKMLLKEYPDIEVHYVKDVRSDIKWSQFLDAQIRDMVPPTHSVGLFGSRDSFVSHYNGSFYTVELEAERYVSGTEQRDRISRDVRNSMEFRAGQIFAAYGMYPTSFQTTDIIVYDPANDAVLLGKKAGETEYRFFGGFVDPTDETLELAALRELREEAGVDLNTNSPVYLGSFRVDDWRYRSERDKIMTAVYQVNFMWGRPDPGDDIEEVRWFPYNEVSQNLLTEHRKIWEKIIVNRSR